MNGTPEPDEGGTAPRDARAGEARAPEGRVHAARVRGMHRGADLHDVAATVALHEGGLEIRGATPRPIALGWAALEGVHREGTVVTLYIAGDDALELELAEAPALARELVEGACRVGELALPLRGLGSHRAFPGSEHERFYGPFLAARRALERAGPLEAQLATFNAARLERGARDALAAFAVERFPGSPADRRALEAELLDDAEGLLAALARLGAAAERVRRAPDDVRLARWREWIAAVRAVFAHADRAWIAALPALAGSRRPKPGFWRRLFGRGGAALLLAAGAGARELRAQGAPDPHATLRVANATAADLARRGFDVVGALEGAPLVVARAAERARLAALGFEAAPLARGAEARRLARAVPGAALVAPAVFRPFDDPSRGVRAWIDSLARALPDLVHVDSIGASWEGRPILAVKVGAADDAPTRPNVVFMGTYHAREWIAAETARRLVRHLATADDARTRALVAARDVWVIPVVNPDGYQYTFDADRLWRKNRRSIAGDFGVDLNRNHAERWGWDNQGSSPYELSEVYRGPSAASEPETRAVQLFHDRVQPVASVSYHSYGDLMLFPPGYAFGLLAQDLSVYRALAGDPARPAILDRVPRSVLDRYRPGPAWTLYPTNGDYTDWAAARHGTLALTVELTSGCDGDCFDGYYGFEFPDDEALIERVFQDNLPFALDLVDAAADPMGFTSPTTGRRAERLALESVSPIVRVRAAAATAPAVSLRVARTSGAIESPSLRGEPADSTQPARWMRRLASPAGGRVAAAEVDAGGTRAIFETLLMGGAEPGDTGWTANGFVAATSAPLAGRARWETGAMGTLVSPAVRVPAGVDTVTVLWWQQHDGDSFTQLPWGELRVQREAGGAFVPEMRVVGQGSAWYPERVVLGGVAGATLRLEFVASRMPWRLDEIAIVAHGGDPLPPDTERASLAAVTPSENPVRAGRVRFAWPTGLGAGDLTVYDFAGRRVFRQPVPETATAVEWDVEHGGVANGAYIVVATAGGRSRRLTLYVARTTR